DKRWFIGVPSPTAAALVAGLIWVHHGYERLPYINYIALGITLFAGLSMVVQIKFWSFKELSTSEKPVPFFAMVLLVCGLLLLFLQPSVVLFLCFLTYSLSGYFMWLWRFLRRKKQV
ncbi:MAG: CDP-diacylglycerol--serine O-phosphatidyltransferase, partial [Neisseriaceae bacterium]|nr:CDP-diacylglycerol--serine O-phosphatidyltransferase [Neisseriaceae bacterium]